MAPTYWKITQQQQIIPCYWRICALPTEKYCPAQCQRRYIEAGALRVGFIGLTANIL